MKNNLLTFVLFVLSFSTLNAQSYSFSVTTSTYQDLTSPTVISTPDWTEFDVFKVKLPFKFNYYGVDYDSIFAMGGFDGFVYENTGGNQYFPSDQIYTFDNGMVDAGSNSSPIAYQVTGSSPNRVFVLQTKNAHFSSDESGNDYANVQLWLYEKSNIIEIHYGPSSILNSESWQVPNATGPSVGVYNTLSNFISLSGAADNPTVSTQVISIAIDGVPSTNKVYRFAPTKAGIVTMKTNDVQMFPNPSSDILTIKNAQGKNIQIIDLYGKVLFSQEQLNNMTELHLASFLTSGVYMVNISEVSGELISSSKLVFN